VDENFISEVENETSLQKDREDEIENAK